jgi:hypothetical protein
MRSAGVVFACLLVGSICSPSMASFTTINAPAGGENSQAQILSHTYSGTFVPVPGTLNYTNGTLIATRVEDTYTGNLTPLSPLSVTGNVGNDDQVWHADFKFVSAEAVFADYNQEFGYFDPTTNAYTQLITNIGHNYNVTTTSVNISSLSGDTIRWARGGDNGVFSSRISDNPDGVDHMVTYRIDGLSDASSGMLTWVLFWEDMKKGQTGADFDFQDLAVQIKAMPLVSSPAPEPTAVAALAVAGLFGLGRRRRA